MGKVPMTHGSVLPEWGHLTCLHADMELKIRDLQYHGTVFLVPTLAHPFYTDPQGKERKQPKQMYQSQHFSCTDLLTFASPVLLYYSLQDFHPRTSTVFSRHVRMYDK